MSLIDFLLSHQTLSIIGLLLLLAYAYHVLLITPDPSEPPLIKGYVPFLGVAPQAIPRPRGYLTQCRRQNGDIFTLYALGKRVTIVIDPIEGIPSILRQSNKLSFKAAFRILYIKALGMTPERADMEEMNKEHLALHPPYLLAKPAVDELTARFIRILTKDLRKDIEGNGSQEGKVVNLFDWAPRLLFFAASSALWGQDIFDDEKIVFDDFMKMDADFQLRMTLPSWMTKGYERSIGRLKDTLGRKFEKGLKDPSNFALKRIEISQKYGHSRFNAGQDVLGITFASVTNSMPIMFWFLSSIISSEKYYKLALERIDSYALPGASISSDNLFNVSALLSDPFLQACFQETLRFPIQGGATRIVNEATTVPVGGKHYYLRKGSVVFIPTPLLHRDNDIYSNPDEFQPERFLDADLESALISLDSTPTAKTEKKSGPPKFYKKGVPVKHYLLAFGGGESLCSGRRFAQNEIIGMVSTLLYLFEFESPNGGKLEKPAKSASEGFSAARKWPGKPYMVKMRLRKH